MDPDTEPLHLLLPVLLHQPTINGCPIHRALCDGWDHDHHPATEPLHLLLPVLLHQPTINGCPIHRALCDGWESRPSSSHRAFAVAFGLCRCLRLPSSTQPKARHFDRRCSRTLRAAKRKNPLLRTNLPQPDGAFAVSPTSPKTSMPFEVLDRPLVLLRLFARSERAQVLPPPGLRILVP